jgi:hypothetical protein
MINKVYKFVSDNFTKTEVPEFIKEADTEAYRLLVKFRKETYVIGWIFGPPLLFIYSYVFVNIITSILMVIIYIIFTKVISKRWSLHEVLLLILPPSAFIIPLLMYSKFEERRNLEYVNKIYEL